MTYELLNFRQMIDAGLGEKTSPDHNLSESEEDLKEQSAAILASIQDRAAAMGPDAGRSYIRQHQMALGLIVDDLQAFTETSPTSAAEKTDLLNIYKNTSEQLLSLLERHFPFYFDYSTKAYHSLLNSSRIKFRKKTGETLCLLESSNITQDKLRALGQLLEALYNENQKISYRRIMYLEEFFGALNTTLKDHHGPVEVLDLILTLISLELNHPAFYHFACGYFNEEAGNCESMADQYRTLNFLKKTVRQTPNIAASPYNEDQPPVAGSLQRYLDAELEYLKSLELTAGDLSSGGLLDKNFKVTFTVRQLAIFIHLQVEAGIIAVQSPNILHRYITKHYSTLEKSSISEKSFKNAYYGNAGKDMEKVLSKIVSMLAIAREKY